MYTDHKTLIYALKASSDKYNPRDIAQLYYILHFISDIRYVKGSGNPFADALSRDAVDFFTSVSGI